ncbi:MAG: hypothetical protein VX910_05860 [Candidatus Latescibacterota bacterium]|nr:hypothetical protein [Candidatus Latescibacterota bacterium]
MRRYTLDEAMLIYRGLGSYVGQTVSQNGDGEVIGHIRVIEAVCWMIRTSVDI